MSSILPVTRFGMASRRVIRHSSGVYRHEKIYRSSECLPRYGDSADDRGRGRGGVKLASLLPDGCHCDRPKPYGRGGARGVLKITRAMAADHWSRISTLLGQSDVPVFSRSGCVPQGSYQLIVFTRTLLHQKRFAMDGFIGHPGYLDVAHSAAVLVLL